LEKVFLVHNFEIVEQKKHRISEKELIKTYVYKKIDMGVNE
jgi:hypothetical protein